MGYAARIGTIRNVYNIFIGEPERKAFKQKTQE
jgi:hypothetical protein